MSDLNSSNSLQIVERADKIQFNDSQSKSQKIDDLLDYSRDQNSFSFHIEQDRPKEFVYSSVESVLQEPEIKQEEPKRKRKEIFEKYKKSQKIIQQPLPEKQSNSILNIFDQIFKFKSRGEENSNSISNYAPNFKRQKIFTQTKSRSPSTERNDRARIFGKKTTINQSKATKIEQPLTESKEHLTKVELPKQESPKILKNTNQIATNISPITSKNNLQQIQNRVSIILAADTQIQNQRDSFQFSNILQAEIFNSKFQEKSNKPQIKYTESKIHQQLSQSIIIFDQKSKSSVKIEEPSQKEQKMKPQQKVEEMSSIAPSIFVNNYQQDLQSRYVINEAIKSPIGALSQNNFFTKNQEKSIILNLPQSMKNIYEEQSRIAIFLRKLKLANCIYPNFHNKNTKKQKVIQDLHVLINLFSQAITLLNKTSDELLAAKTQKVMFNQKFYNESTLEFFLTSGWEKSKTSHNLELIKPRSHFLKRICSYENVKTALASYQNVVNYYQNISQSSMMSLEEQKYLKIREKFWQIERNLTIIAEDIYSEFLECEYPPHYYEFLQFMRQPFGNSLHSDKIKYLKQLQNKLFILKRKNDELINSEIGKEIKKKLQTEMKYVCPY